LVLIATVAIGLTFAGQQSRGSPSCNVYAQPLEVGRTYTRLPRPKQPPHAADDLEASG
jgi:hypothetical protein